MYNWAVIEIHNNDPVLYYSDNPILRNPCDSPGSIFCNTTGNMLCLSFLINFFCLVYDKFSSGLHKGFKE